MYKNIATVMLFLYQLSLYNSFNYFADPNIGQVKHYIDRTVFNKLCTNVTNIQGISDYIDTSQNLGQGGFGSVRAVKNSKHLVVKQQQVCNDQSKNQFGSFPQIEKELYFLYQAKSNLTHYQNSVLQDQFLRIIDCKIYNENSDINIVKDPKNRCVYFFFVFQRYDFDMSYIIDRNKQVILQEQGLLTKEQFKKHDYSNYDQILKYEMGVSLFEQLEYLHSLDIVHGDIKPDNILVKSSMSLQQIIDLRQKEQEEQKQKIAAKKKNYPQLTFTLSDYGLCQYEYGIVENFNKLYTHPVLRLMDSSRVPALKSSDVYSLSLSIISILLYGEPPDYKMEQTLQNQYDQNSIPSMVNKYIQNMDRNNSQFERNLFDGFFDMKKQLENSTLFIDNNNRLYQNSLNIENLMFNNIISDINNIPSATQILQILRKQLKKNEMLQITRDFENYRQNVFSSLEQMHRILQQNCDINYLPTLPTEQEYFSFYQFFDKCSDQNNPTQVNFDDGKIKYPLSLVYITLEGYLTNWESAIVFYKFYQHQLQDFVNMNYYYYFEVANKDKPIWQYNKSINFFSFYCFNFNDSYSPYLQQPIPIDDNSQITRNFLNLFKGLHFVQQRFHVFMNISPRTVVQISKFETLKDLNLRILALPIFVANTNLRQLQQTQYFLYPLQNKEYYNYQADTYSLSLTCIYILFFIYSNKRESSDFMNQFFQDIDHFTQNRRDIIVRQRLNIHSMFYQYFRRELQQASQCNDIQQFPDNIICLLYKQIYAETFEIQELDVIVEQMEKIHKMELDKQQRFKIII